MVTTSLMQRGRHRLSLDPSVRTVKNGAHACELCDAHGNILAAVDSRAFPLIEQLNAGISESQLVSTVADLGAWDAGLLVASTAADLAARGLLHRTLTQGHREVARFVQDSEHWTWIELCAEPNKVYRLSRFAFLRTRDNLFCCESPTVHGYLVVLDHAAAATIARLSVATEVAALPDPDRDFANFMLSCGLLVVEGEEERGPLKFWEFHDLQFHVRSRGDRTSHRGGGTYRFAGSEPAPPAISRRSPSSRDIALRSFDTETLFLNDPPYGVVQSKRRSQRKFGSEPLHLDQLAEFLFRVARVRKVLTDIPVPTNVGPIRMDFALRPYPGGGALYESDLYVLLNRLEQPEHRGLYKYDGVEHALRFCAPMDMGTERILAKSGWATGIDAQSIQVLVLVAARFSRMQWKYETAAYSAMLKNTGVIIQTMYLAAATMGLACCANGQGESELFSRAIGADYYDESSIGEMILGTVAGETNGSPRCG